MRTFCTFCGAANAVEAQVCYACATPLPATAAPAPNAPTWQEPAANGPYMAGATSPPSEGFVAPPQPWESTHPFPSYPAAVPPPRYGGAGFQPYTPPAGQGTPEGNSVGWQAVPGYGPPPAPSGQSYAPQAAPPHGYHPAQPYAGGPYQAQAYGGPQPGQGYAAPPYPGSQGYGPATAYPAPYGQPPGYGYPAGAYPGYGTLPMVPGAGSLADAGPRFGAYLLDTIILSAPLFVGLLFVGATGSTGLSLLWLLMAVLGPALYFILSWANGGRTIGYRAMGLQLIRSDGTQPGFGAAFARYLGVFLCHLIFFPGMLGVLWLLWDNKRQAWYDKMADTLVVKS